MAQTGVVGPEPPVLPGNGGSYGYISRSASSAFSPLRQRPQLGPRARSASSTNLGNIPERAVRFRDDTLLDQRNREQDVLAELIDFLRNHTPPSDNFMSIPDGPEGEDRGRWSMLKRLGRKKSTTKTPQQIRLPDSAISGTTIGGHRHIAISIPLAASPFGQNPRSQYPIYQNQDFKPIISRYTPTRAVLNEKGVVTVLQGITETRESPAHSPVIPSRYQFPTTLQRAPAPTKELPRPPAGHSKNISQGESSDYPGLLPDPLRISPPGVVKAADDSPRELHRESFPGVPIHYRANLPARASSLIGGRLFLPEDSIDAVMSRRDDSDEALAVPPNILRTVSQESVSRSINTMSENSPVISDAQQVQAARATPILLQDSDSTTTEKETEEPTLLVITQSPLAPTDKPKSPTPSVKSTQSRRDKVRAKKLKDLEAARNRQRKLSQQSESDDQEPAPVPPARSTLRPKSNPPSLRTEESPKGPRMSSIMVVTDVHPSPPPVEGQPSMLAQSLKEAPKESPKASSVDRPQTPPSPSKYVSAAETTSRPVTPRVASFNSSSGPTPPQSANGSPPQRRPSFDRASLTRRREWNAAREKERKARAIREKAKELGINQEEPAGSSPPPVEQEVLRRYEAYREYRIREMERRVRRLERNGDVWLRALIPVLDNLNRTLVDVHKESSPSKAQGWASDDSTGGSVDARGRSLGYHKQNIARAKAARRGTSEKQFLEQLSRKREELEGDSDDMSGFDTIEPLMRELAGRSRLSFEARRAVGV